MGASAWINTVGNNNWGAVDEPNDCCVQWHPTAE